jgi:hypothetical protein
MLNILIPKKPKVIWWSTVEGLEKVAPIVPSREAPLPSYWKDIPRQAADNPFDKGTLKACPALPDFFEMGYVVPLWSDTDFVFEAGENGNVKYTVTSSDTRFSFTHHGDNQFKDYLPVRVKESVKMVLKSNCPWRVKTPPGYSVLQLPMYYHFDQMFEVLPGVIWTDIHHEINQQMVVKEYGEFTLKRGHPLAMYVPYRREEFSMEIQGPTAENKAWDIEARTHLWTKFRAGYRANQARVSKCPFSK